MHNELFLVMTGVYLSKKITRTAIYKIFLSFFNRAVQM